MVIKVGVIGFSEGNGHPFSFSAIINGYDDDGFAAAGWTVIHEYLNARNASEFGFEGVSVTHAWTQNRDVTQQLCSACKISTACSTPMEMIDAVDAILIARDDWECHATLSMPFLEAGKFVFVDKPLSLDADELTAFEPYLCDAKLMSTSGLRYARELDPLRGCGRDLPIGKPKLITGTVLNGLEKYGIHLIEAVASLGGVFAQPRSISRLDADHDAFAIRLGDGTLFQLNCLGKVGKTFRLNVFGEQGHQHFDLYDNFSAFKRTLGAFFRMIQTGHPAIEPDETLAVMNVLRAGISLKPGQSLQLQD